MIRSRRLIACLVALLLVLAQQAAVAHLIGHSGVAAESSANSGEDSGHNAALTLSHQCTTCLAFAVLASSAPLGTSLSFTPAAIAAAAPPQLRQTPRPQRAVLAYRSRAPPA